MWSCNCYEVHRLQSSNFFMMELLNMLLLLVRRETLSSTWGFQLRDMIKKPSNGIPCDKATKEIFCNSGLRLMTPNTCIGWFKVRSSTEISIRMLFLNFSEMDHKYIYRTKIPLQPVFLPLCQPHQMLILKNYTHCLLKKIILEAKKLLWPINITGWHRGVPTQCIASKFNTVKGQTISQRPFLKLGRQEKRNVD